MCFVRSVPSLLCHHLSNKTSRFLVWLRFFKRYILTNFMMYFQLKELIDHFRVQFLWMLGAHFVHRFYLLLTLEDLTCHLLINRHQKTSLQSCDHANTRSCFPSANTDTTSFIQTSSNSFKQRANWRILQFEVLSSGYFCFNSSRIAVKIGSRRSIMRRK